MRYKLAMTLALLTTLGLGTACDDDTTGPDEEEKYLSPAEQEALVGALMTEMASRPFSSRSGTLRPDSSRPILSVLDTVFEFEASCSLGGTVSIRSHWSTAVDTAAETRTLESSGTQVARECARAVYPTPHYQLEVTVTGDPGLSYSSRTVFERIWSPGDPLPRQLGNMAVTMTLNGAFIWATNDGRSGRCEIDVTGHSSFDADTRTVTGRRQGTICGRNVDRKIRL